jgi:hypothetical protein
MKALTMVACFAGGYVAAIFTWQAIHTWIIGAEAKAAQLRDRAKALVAKAKAAL